ncbi:MAG: NINE protein [Treponema sp.]|nr:NINE protein [Treponema sp.]
MYSTGMAYLLWFLSGFGALGFHRFYLGKIPTGFLWMFTVGLGWIGAIYDFLTLPGQVREANIREANIRNALFDRMAGGAGRDSGGDQTWRRVNDGEARIVGETESMERIILKLAKKNRGILTVSEVVIAANTSVDQARKDLDALVSKGIAELRVRKSGTLVYVIPEMTEGNEDLEDPGAL